MTDLSHRLRSSPLARRPMQTLTELVDRRVERALAGSASAIEVLSDELTRTTARLRTLELLLDASGRGTPRAPRPEQLASLQREVAAVCGDPVAAQRAVHGSFRLVVAFEALGVGRIAGSTMNICGKLATISLLDAPAEEGTVEVLEIGTLYGLFAAALLRAIERTGRRPRLTVLDPLIGNQLQPGTSIGVDASGTPVAEAAVRTNLALAGASGEAARVHVGYSTDPAARAAVADRSYGVVVVDGDHSYDGVRADLRWVEEVVAPGGLVVLDDYGDAKWRGVEQALDDHLAAGGSRFTLLGRVSTSGYLRAS